jgi:hypothetical protein
MHGPENIFFAVGDLGLSIERDAATIKEKQKVNRDIPQSLRKNVRC